MIHDKFTHLKISRARRYQLRQQAKGRCPRGCGRKLKPGYTLCRQCLREQNQRYHASNNGKP